MNERFVLRMRQACSLTPSRSRQTAAEPMPGSPDRLRAGRWSALLAAFLVVWLGYFVWETRSWPLVGDASIIQYAAFLIGHGFAPYRQIVEMNFPGAYLAQWVVMHTLGGGALAWRAFDFSLLAAIGAAMMVMARPYGLLGGFAAGSLFALIHGQDGVALSGERDLIVTALFAWACALVFLAIRRDKSQGRISTLLIFSAALACGITATMKPVAIPAGPLLIGFAILRLRHMKRPYGRALAAGCAGYALPMAATGIYLLQVQALAAFWSTMLGLARYYSGLYQKPPMFLLTHSIAPIGPMVAVWLVVAVLRRSWTWEQWMLAGGALYGLVYYCAQTRGFPYYRYPVLFFLLLLMGMEFEAALRRRPRLSAGWLLAVAASAYALFFLVPRSALKAGRYDWRNQDFITLLSSDLQQLGGRQLAGKVQCLDTTAGCINTLYRMRLVQATGFFYDCYAYSPRGREMANTVEQYRRRFRDALEASSPRVLVVTNQYCQQGPDTYAKLQRWPWLEDWIQANYSIYTERLPQRPVYWWSRPEKPFGYRIYLRR